MTQRFHQVLASLLLTFSLSTQAGSGGISLGQTRVIFLQRIKRKPSPSAIAGNRLIWSRPECKTAWTIQPRAVYRYATAVLAARR